MSKPKTIKTIFIEEIEFAAAIECHSPGCALLTGQTPADKEEHYMFMDTPEVRAIIDKLKDGSLDVNFRDYMEKLRYFQDWLVESYRINKDYADTEKIQTAN